MKYRSEIDGLRAIAVLPVLLFHANVEGFSGGFVGVDIFFVISGFLITKILISDLEMGKFSITRFYERRARRILPALGGVLIFSSLMSYFLFTPEQFKDYGQSLFSVGLFASNFFFWWKSGYFSPSAEEAPLLHTWSLSVEEQFYIIFPLLLAILWKYGLKRKGICVALGIVSLLSLGLSQYLSVSAPMANFYLLPSRAWELLGGALCATATIPALKAKNRSLLTWLGIGLIAISITWLDEATPFPSIFALLPVVGTMLFLLFASADSYPGKLVASPPLRLIGLISYSLYLWHQPFLAFYRVNAGPNATSFGLILAMLLSFPFAWLSWKYIEAPFRTPAKTGGFNAKKIFAFSAILLATTLGLGGATAMKMIQLPYSIPEQITDTFVRVEATSNCFDSPYSYREKNNFCRIGSKDVQPDFLVLGDSHSLSLKNTIDLAGKRHGRAGLYVGYSGCPPLLGLKPDRKDQAKLNCKTMVERSFADAAAKNIKNVILIAKWDYYVGQGGQPSDYDEIQWLYTANHDVASSLSENRLIFENGLQRTVAFAKRNGMALHIIQQVPHQKYSPESAYYAAVKDGESAFAWRQLSRKDFEIASEPANRYFSGVQARNSNVSFHLVGDYFCSTDVCPIGTKDTSRYFDTDHLSLAGSELVKPLMDQILR